MRYIIFCKDGTCFETEWYGEEMFNPETMHVVIDHFKKVFTTDGKEWRDITEDHL